MTTAEDKKRLSEIEVLLNNFIDIDKKHNVHHDISEWDNSKWIVKSLRAAWGREEILKKALEKFAHGLPQPYDNATQALKRAEEIK